ncbi:MAG: HAD family hydrolase [Candidatus Acidiferrales bacterium]
MSDNHKFSSVRALIFDLDGTLIDSKLDLALAVNAALGHMGLAPLEHEQIFGYVGQGAPMLMRRSLGSLGTHESVERALKYFLAYYREHMLDNTVTYPGVREALAEFSRRGPDASGRGTSVNANDHKVQMAVLTNKPVRFSKLILEGLGIATHFEYVYGGNSFERKKPDPIGVETLLRDFGRAPHEALMVGDSVIDILTARNAGIWACGVTYGLGSHRLAEHPPDILLDNLADLPQFLVP